MKLECISSAVNFEWIGQVSDVLEVYQDDDGVNYCIELKEPGRLSGDKFTVFRKEGKGPLGAWGAGDPYAIFEIVGLPSTFCPDKDTVVPMCIEDKFVPMVFPEFSWKDARRFVRDREINFPMEVAHRAVEYYRKLIEDKNNARPS